MHLTGLADVELLVRMLEKEGGLVGPTLKKKKKSLGLMSGTGLEDCWSLASLSSARFPLSSQPSGHQL